MNTNAQEHGAESKEDVMTFNITDVNILEKLAKVNGTEISDFHQQEFEQLKRMNSEGKDSEWFNNKTGAKFFMLKSGEMIVGNKSPQDVKDRAREMGMRAM